MTVGKHWNSDWLRNNSLRSYPLMDGVSGKSNDADAAFTIPQAFLLDISLTVKPDDPPGQFHIMQIASYSGGYVVTIGRGGTAVAVFTVARSNHYWSKVYRIVGTGTYEGYNGYVSIGDLEEIDAQSAGVWSFDVSDGLLQPRCLIPMTKGLSGIRISAGGDLSPVLTGTVRIEQGPNTRLRWMGGSTIRIDAVSNPEYAIECQCEGQYQLGPPIRTINGLQPTAAGDFIISEQSCIQVEASENGLTVRDTCSEPCCGCEELAVVNTALKAVRDQMTTLNSFVSRLESRQESMDTIMTQTIARFPQSG